MKKSRYRYSSPLMVKSYKDFQRTQQYMRGPIKQNSQDNRSNSSNNPKLVMPLRPKDALLSKKLGRPASRGSKNDLNASRRFLKNESRSLLAKEGVGHNSSNTRRSNLHPNRLNQIAGLVHDVDAPNQFNNKGQGNLGREAPNQSNLSTTKDLLVSNKEPLSDKKHPVDVASGNDKEMEGHTSVASSEGVMSEVHSMYEDEDHRKHKDLKAKEAPNSSFAMKGSKVMHDPQSKSGINDDVLSHPRDVASCKDDNMKWNGDPSGGCLDGEDRNPMFAKGGSVSDVEFKRGKTEQLVEEQLMVHVDECEEIENSRPTNKRRRLKKDHHPKASPTFVLGSTNQKFYTYSQPIDEPIWSGIFEVDSKYYVSLTAHVSTKSCKKVWTLSKSLLPVVKLAKISRLEVWPESWKAPIPTDDNIGLYFFPHEMRPDENLDQLVKEITENEIVLRALIGEAEMLIFPSILLPKRYQTFRMKHYLWGLFKRRNDMVTGAGFSAQDAEMEEQHGSHQQDEVQCGESDDEPLTKRSMRLKKQQRLLVTGEGVDQQGAVRCEDSDVAPLTKRAARLKNQRSLVTGEGVGQQDEVRREDSDDEPLMKRITRLKKQRAAQTITQQGEAGHVPLQNAEPSLADAAAPTIPAATSGHGQTHAGIVAPAGTMLALIVEQTPTIAQHIEEIKRKGAVLFAMQGEAIGSGFRLATAAQKYRGR